MFSSDKTQLISSSYDKTIAFWDLESLTLQKSLPMVESVNSLDIAPDSRLLASASPYSVQLRDIETGGKSLYSSSFDQTARRYRLGNTGAKSQPTTSVESDGEKKFDAVIFWG